MAAGHWDDEFPDRRLPDRLGHLDEHEHERGPRHPRQRAARAPRSTPTTTSTPRSPPTTCSRRRSTWPRPREIQDELDPGPRPPGRGAAQEEPGSSGASSSPAGPTSWTPRRSPSARSSAATPPPSSTASSGSQAALPRVGELPLGGTAVGTGINAPEGLRPRASSGGWPRSGASRSREARDHFEAQGARDALVEASGVLRTIAVSLYKCANDLRWMGSGPRTGLAEIRLPDLQPGSSIMPGKVNPVIPEAVSPGRGPGDRQRRGRRLRRRGRQLRAQRDAAGDRPQPARVDPPAGRR